MGKDIRTKVLEKNVVERFKRFLQSSFPIFLHIHSKWNVIEKMVYRSDGEIEQHNIGNYFSFSRSTRQPAGVYVIQR